MVLPDGCRDLIFRDQPQREWSYDVTQLDNTAYQVESTDSETFIGFRFQPAVRIDEQGLLDSLKSKRFEDIHQIKMELNTLLPDHVVLDERLHEVLSALSSTATITVASRFIGVSERTLERLVQSGTSRTPVFWKSLARARQCAKTVADQDIPLAQIAADHGYADQSHMSREFKRWFGVTPVAFAKHLQLSKTIYDSGYGD